MKTRHWLFGFFLTLIIGSGISALNAAPVFKQTFSATSYITPIKQMRHLPDNSLLVMGVNTSNFGKISADGSSYTAINYNIGLPAMSGIDFITSGNNTVYISINGTTHNTYQYQINGSVANFVSSINATSPVGSQSIAQGVDGRFSVIRGTGSNAIKFYNKDLSQIGVGSVSVAAIRSYINSDGVLYYITSSGQLRKSPSFVTTTESIVTANLGTGSLNAPNALVINPNNTGYISSRSMFLKIVLGGKKLWRIPTGNASSALPSITTMTTDPEGRIYLANGYGQIVVYNPINKVTQFSAENNAPSVILRWVSGVTDMDFSGVMIRRSTSGYPASASDGELVTSNCKSNTFEDSGLHLNTTYYYTIFNTTLDGFYSEGVTCDVTVLDTNPPENPSSFTATTSGSTALLSWSNPVSDFDSVQIRRSSSEFPNSISSGTLITTNYTAQSFLNTDLSDGAYYYTIFARDSAGNFSSGVTASVTIDTTPPSPPTLTALKPSENGREIVLTWTVPLGSTYLSLMRVFSDQTVVIVSSNISPSTTTFQLQNLTDGTYSYAISATDAFSNTSERVFASATIHYVEPVVPTPAPGVLDRPTDFSTFITEGRFQSGLLTISRNITTLIVAPKIGQDRGKATLNVSASYVSSRTQLGVGVGSIGTIVLASQNAQWHNTGSVEIGYEGGSGVVLHSQGTVTIEGELHIGSSTSSTGRYVFSDGVLKTSVLTIGSTESSGSFIWTGGRLETAQIQGNLHNQGGTLVVNETAPLTLDGDYLQDLEAALSFTVSGTRAVFDTKTLSGIDNAVPLLTTTGTFSASGTITVALEGYTPKIGDGIALVHRSNTASLRIMEDSNLTFNLPALDSRLAWDTSSFETLGIIQVKSSDTSSLLVDRPLNYPNPFKMLTGTQIGYFLNEDAAIELRIYTATGGEIYKAQFLPGIDEGAKAGYNKITLNRTILGAELPSGVYPYVLIHEGSVIGRGKLVVRP